jgi:hypothetical protein
MYTSLCSWISDHLGPLEMVPTYQKECIEGSYVYIPMFPHVEFHGSNLLVHFTTKLGNLDMLHTWK